VNGINYEWVPGALLEVKRATAAAHFPRMKEFVEEMATNTATRLGKMNVTIR
jgi:hypothetical protein